MISTAGRESNKGSPHIATGSSSALEFPETLKRRKANAISPQISGKTCTPRIDSTTVYSYQTENDAEPPVDPVRTTYCIHCINARDTLGYHERVANLMSRLWCSGCEAEHPAVQFSFASRRANPSSRLCIAHQGHFTVCPHLQISLDDLRLWRNVVETQSIHCTETTCPCRGITVRYTGISEEFPFLDSTVCVSWIIPLESSNRDTALMDRCIAKTKEVHRAYPQAFCPAFNVTPGRVLQARFFGEPEASISGMTGEYCRCSDNCTVGYVLGFNNDSVELGRVLYMPNDVDGPVPKHWIHNLDPESYDHFRDPETMHITWCCDPTCATTAELIKFNTMVTMDESYWSGPDEPTARSNFLDSLVDKKIRYIMSVN